MISKSLERDLIDNAQRGELAALGTLYGFYLPWLERFIRRAAGGAWSGKLDPKEVLGETWLAVQSSFPKFEDRGPGSFKKWVTKIARRRLIDHQMEIIDHNRSSIWANLVANAKAGFTRSPIKQAGRRECYRIVRDAVRGLPRRLRLVVYLHYFRGYTLEQIADRLHTTKRAVGRWLRKARTALSVALPVADEFPSSLRLRLRQEN